MGFFELTVPDESIPVLVEIPHAGLDVPEAVQHQLIAPYECLLRDADIYVDKLCAGVSELGAARLASTVSRYVVDLNRSAGDVDLATVPDHPAPVYAQPRGVVWRMTTDGRPVLRQPLTYEQLQQRLATFYEPYHAALQRTLRDLQRRHGYAILLAAHSMPSRGRSLHDDTGSRRADIVPGTRGRTSAHPAVIDLVDAHFREAGLSVRHDDPYQGGFTTTHYGRPEEGVHAVQVEVSRALYVNEHTCEVLSSGGFEHLRQLLEQLVAKLGALRF